MSCSAARIARLTRISKRKSRCSVTSARKPSSPPATSAASTRCHSTPCRAKVWTGFSSAASTCRRPKSSHGGFREDLIERVKHPQDLRSSSISMGSVPSSLRGTPTRASTRRSIMRGFLQAPPERAARVRRSGSARDRRGLQAASLGCGHSGSAGVRRPRQPRHDRGGRICPDQPDSLLRHLLWLPVGRRGIRSERRGD